MITIAIPALVAFACGLLVCVYLVAGHVTHLG